MALPRPLPELEAEAMMRRAIAVARTTPPADVPVGAVLFDANGHELASATNRRETDLDPTAHAEVLAIRAAARQHGDGWRLTDCTLVVTLEPCTMCAGAVLGARVGRVIFGAWEPKTGACGSIVDVLRNSSNLHTVQVRGGVLELECADLLTDFFTSVRLGGPNQKEEIMSDFKNKLDDVVGQAKENVGEATGNEKLADEGRADQTKADIKDAVKETSDKVLGAFQKDK